MDPCRASIRQLSDSVRERLPDVLLALVDAVAGLHAQGQVTQQLMQQVACLKLFVLGLESVGGSVGTEVFERINACTRALGV